MSIKIDDSEYVSGFEARKIVFDFLLNSCGTGFSKKEIVEKTGLPEEVVDDVIWKQPNFPDSWMGHGFWTSTVGIKRKMAEPLDKIGNRTEYFYIPCGTEKPPDKKFMPKDR